MTRDSKLILLNIRANRLMNNSKNIKSEGVLKKCLRKINKLRSAE